MSDLIREAGEKEIELIVDKLDVTNPRDIVYAHKKYDIDILISNAGNYGRRPNSRTAFGTDPFHV